MENKKQEEQLRQAVEYFRRPCYERLFQQLFEKCYSLGRLGGTVRLNHLKSEEADALEGFLQKDCHNKKSISISVSTLRKALQKTRFEKVSLEELVTNYFHGSIVTKKEEELKAQQIWKEWFYRVISGFEDTPAGIWFQTVCDQKVAPYSSLVRDYKNEKEWLEENIRLILRALNALPVWKDQKQRLPIFAAEVSGNPHYFDLGERAHLYLIYGICAVTNIQAPKKLDASVRKEILFQAGVLTDELSNKVMTYGIYGEDVQGEKHLGMEYYVTQKEPLNLSVANLLLLQCAWTTNKKVYIVENPMIFEWLMKQDIEKGFGAALICSEGQPSQAVWLLLDLLYASDTKMYYSGDFDPEGLLIAQKMKERYSNALQLWHYQVEDYQYAKSNTEISETRLKQLMGVQVIELLPVSKELLKTKLAGYQENMLEAIQLESDIKPW